MGDKINILHLSFLTFLTILNVSCAGQITNCEFVDLNIYHVRLSCEEFHGAYEPFECFYATFKNKYLKDKVQILETGDCQGNRLNTSFTDYFRSLLTYDIVYYGIEHLSAADINFRNLKQLNASHNELVTIHETTFDNTPKLQELDFSFNKIMILEKNAFSGLDELQILVLKGNLIKVIDETTFKHNKNLKELNLEENPLKRFDGNIFWPLLNSANVRISCDHLKEFDTSCLKASLKIEFQKKKNVIFSTSESSSTLIFPKNSFKNLTYFNISGNHLNSTSKLIELLGSSVEILDLSSNILGKSNGITFEFIRIFGYFQNLSHLALSNMNLTEVNATESQLKVLNLSKNALTSLNFTGTFANLYKFDASHNNLIEITPSIFDSTPNVVEINLSHNKISTFAKETFATLENLQLLDLSNNLITSIDKKLFENNKKLMKLIVENNLIGRIDCEMFELLKNSLDVNEKKQASEEFEDKWKSVVEIDMSCMKNDLKIDVDDINGAIFRRDNNIVFRCSKATLQNLKYLNISGLHLQDTAKLLQFFGSSLEKLDVSSNFIGELHEKTFDKLTNLQVLNLSRTNLSNFGFETFYHHKKLQSLDLSYNQLKKLNFTLLFRNFKNLNTLNLEGNDLTEVDTVTNVIFPKLTSLAISKNDFTCDYLAIFLVQWHNLHLVNNPTNQMNIDGVDCYHKASGFDGRSDHETTNEPKGMETSITDVEFHLEAASTEFKNDEGYNKNEINNSTQTESDTSENEMNQNGSQDQSTDKSNYYVLELRILEFALAFCVLCAILIIIKLKCTRSKGKMRCNPRVKSRHFGRNSQHGIELIDHETLHE